MDSWVQEHGAEIGRRAERHLEALVAISSPSGDVHGAEECAAVCIALLPDEASVERPPCSSPGHAPDLLARVRGTGRGRLVQLGHLDTVVAHADHKPLTRREDHLIGSGAVDMKGGVVLSLGVLGALAQRPECFEEVALLLVCDEEWRTEPFAHAARFAGWDACLCFEAGERTKAGDEAVVVRRKAAGTIHLTAHGRSAHSGSAPDRGRNALLALAAEVQAVARHHDPHGTHRLTVVPTVLRAGEAFNVVPGRGEALFDLRADSEVAFEPVFAGISRERDGVQLEPQLLRVWPGMDSSAHTAGLLETAGGLLGRPIHPASRGGASDASHFAPVIPVTIDGLGPRGGKAHNPGEFVLAESLVPRAETALALALAALG